VSSERWAFEGSTCICANRLPAVPARTCATSTEDCWCLGVGGGGERCRKLADGCHWLWQRLVCHSHAHIAIAHVLLSIVSVLGGVGVGSSEMGVGGSERLCMRREQVRRGQNGTRVSSKRAHKYQ
jgi:hypothetical protein